MCCVRAMGGVSRVFVLLIISLNLYLNTVEVNAKSSRSHSSHHSSSHHASPSHSSSHSSSHSTSHSGSTHNTHIAHSSHPSSHIPSSSGRHRSSNHDYPRTNGLSGTGSQSSSSSIHVSHKDPSLNSPSNFGSHSSISHRYPETNGLSGTGSQSSSSSIHVGHKDPSLNSPSNFGSHSSISHRYPETNGLSGTGSQSSSSSNHGYTGLNSLSGGTQGSRLSGGGTHQSSVTIGHQSYPSSDFSSHIHPGINSPSGTHVTSKPIYPPSPGLSGTSNIGNRQSKHNTHNMQHKDVHHTTVYHYHHYYTYRPPNVIHFTTSYGTPVTYPVYRDRLPTYVYEYQSSGSRYSNLLSGLALYNLGQTSTNSHFHQYHNGYKPQSNELCKFGVSYDNGNVEEMNVDCRTITNFIWSEQSAPTNQVSNTNTVTNKTIVTTSTVVQNTMLSNGTLVTSNVTYIPPVITNMIPQNITNLLFNGTKVNAMVTGTNSISMLSNGSLVPSSFNLPAVNKNMLPNGTLLPDNTPQVSSSLSVVNTNSVVTTTNNEAINVNDIRFRGAPVKVTSGMECYVIRITPFSSFRNSISCGLLETYAEQSMRKNLAVIMKSSFTFTCVLSTLIIFMFA